MTTTDDAKVPGGPPPSAEDEIVEGEPRGPRPPRFLRVDKPAREIRSSADTVPASGYATSLGGARFSDTEQGRDGFFGGVEHSREAGKGRPDAAPLRSPADRGRRP